MKTKFQKGKRKVEDQMFMTEDKPPVKAKFVTVYSDGSKFDVDCMYGHLENRAYNIDSEKIPSSLLVKEMVDEYIQLPDGQQIRDMNCEF